jgi:hypothetical protein
MVILNLIKQLWEKEQGQQLTGDGEFTLFTIKEKDGKCVLLTVVQGRRHPLIDRRGLVKLVLFLGQGGGAMTWAALGSSERVVMVGENGDTAQLLGREEKIYKSASSGSYHSHTAPHQLSLSLSIANSL